MDYDKIYTLDELLECGIIYCCEYDGKYYINVKTNTQDTVIWIVDKKTRLAKLVYFTELCGIPNKPGARIITNYSELKKAV